MCITACSDPPMPPPSEDGPHFPSVVRWWFGVQLFLMCVSGFGFQVRVSGWVLGCKGVLGFRFRG